MSKFNFTTPASTAATGFSFGANKPAAPSFGLGASPSGGAMSFGNAPSSAPAFGTPATSAPSFGTSFGTPATAAPAFGTSFGSTAPAVPNFGTAISSAPSTGLSFGTTTSAPTGGLNFGAPAAGLGGFSFGGAPAAVTTSAPGGLNFSFGAGLQSTASTQGGFGLAFDPRHPSSSPENPNHRLLTNNPSTNHSHLVFDSQYNLHAQPGRCSPPKQPPMNTESRYTPYSNLSGVAINQVIPYKQGLTPQRFGNLTGNIQTPFIIPGSGQSCYINNLPYLQDVFRNPPQLMTPEVNPMYTPNFASVAADVKTPPSLVNNRMPANFVHLKCATRPNYHFLSPSGKPTTTQADASKPLTTASIGLGGVDSTGLGLTAAAGTAGTGAGQPPSPRMAPLPAELLASVEAFKTSIRQRKQLSSDIARHSIRPLHKVRSDADLLLQEASEMNAKLLDRRRAASSLRSRAAASLPAAERAHRTMEAPHGVEYESGEAVSWIADVVAEGESRLRLLRRQLEAAQRQLGAPPRPVTDQELALGMRRIHESFVAVAGRLQAVHQLVEAQKAQYLSLRRNVLKDPTDVFAEKTGAPGGGAQLSLDWLTKGGAGSSQVPPPSAVVSDPLAALGVNKTKANPLGPTPFSLLGPPGFGGLSFPTKAPATASNTLGNTSSWSFSSPASGLGTTAMGQSWLGGSDQSPFALQKPPAGNKRGKH